MLENAKIEARKMGGNLIKIVEHKYPDILSTCHRIIVNVYKADSIDIKQSINVEVPIDTTLDYAILYVYRFGGGGALVTYNLHLGDSTLCRVSNKSCQEIKITKKGMNELWAKTESKVSLPINVKYGEKYYLRCGITGGIFIGRPSLEYIDAKTGQFEYSSVCKRKNK
ncbi:MAG: hypothetical protein IPO21_01345 [Bacteroidales bacterium]|nr:hypothetical protein [Bacteroidales bacterium]